MKHGEIIKVTFNDDSQIIGKSADWNKEVLVLNLKNGDQKNISIYEVKKLEKLEKI